MRYVLESLLEFFLLISYPVKSLLSFFVNIRAINKKATKEIPVVIVEQWISQNIYHFFLKRYLENRGYKVYVFNSPLLSGSLNDGATALSKFIDRKEIKKCYLIGISIGGLAALLYTQKYGWESVEKIISLGSPFKGTIYAVVFILFKAGRELLPNSEFMKNLKNENIDSPSKIVCITARYDELVPKESSILPGAKHVEIDIAGHNYLHILSKKTYAAIVEELN